MTLSELLEEAYGKMADNGLRITPITLEAYVRKHYPIDGHLIQVTTNAIVTWLVEYQHQQTKRITDMMVLAPYRQAICPRRCPQCGRIRVFALKFHCNECVDETLANYDRLTRPLVPPSYALAE